MSVNIIPGNVLEEDEFFPPEQEVEYPIEVPDHLKEYPEYPAEKSKNGTLKINEKFERTFDEIKEKIIIDPLAFYVPYHSSVGLWGIYFRITKITQDFKNFLDHMKTAIKAPDHWRRWLIFAPYIRVVYFHEMCHHTLEDISLIRGLYSNKHQYPFLAKNEEEGLCEYIAFTQQNRAFNPFSVPSNTLKKAFPSFIIPSPIRRLMPSLSVRFRHLEIINKSIVYELFHYWNRQNDPIYKPKIHPNVGAKVGPLWQSFWRCHVNRWNVIKIFSIKLSEVYDRIFITHH